MFTCKMTTSVIKKFEIIILYYPGRCNIITRILREIEGWSQSRWCNNGSKGQREIEERSSKMLCFWCWRKGAIIAGSFPKLGLPLWFPDSSVGKESVCTAGDLGSSPGSGRSAGEGIGYPLHFSWASHVAQLVERICLQCGKPGFSPWVGKIPWRKERLPTLVFWPGEFQRVGHDWETFTSLTWW